MLKGHVKLQLADGITGRIKEEIEGNNAFTDAINSLLNKCPYGADRRHFSPYSDVSTYENLTNLATTALGGILLFPGDVGSGLYEAWDHMPTGYARVGARDETDLKAGSFNAIESGDIANGYRFVYDFATSNANGFIKTICLTNRYGGEAYGKVNYFGQIVNNVGQIITTSTTRMLGFVGDYFYYIVSATVGLFQSGDSIKRIKRPLLEILINQNTWDDANSELVYSNDVGNARVGLSAADNAIYILSGSTGTTKTLTTIDLSDLTTSARTMTFQHSITEATTSNIGSRNMIAKRGNYLYFVNAMGSENTIYKVNINSTADFDRFDAPVTNIGDLFYLADTGDISSNTFVIDADDNIIEVTAAQYPYTTGHRVGVWQAFSRYPQGSNEARRTPLAWMVNPTYMASKFVLETAVEKTSSLVAKISYEVTHV